MGDVPTYCAEVLILAFFVRCMKQRFVGRLVLLSDSYGVFHYHISTFILLPQN